MAEKTLTQDNFNLLLQWLDADDLKAAAEYERIRERLIRLFSGRGCHEAESLADEVIDRVSRKVSTLRLDNDHKPASYFFGVANKVHLEWLRQRRRLETGEFCEIAAARPTDNAERDRRLDCLESCLSALPQGARDLILAYYAGEKRSKIENRKRLAKILSLTLPTLHVRATRIRSRLHACIANCIAE